MKRLIITLLLILVGKNIFPQNRLSEEVWDPLLNAAVIDERLMDERQFSNIIENEEKIAEHQISIIALQVEMNTIQNKMYKYLKNTNDLLNVPHQIENLLFVSTKIVERMGEIARIVHDHPQLLLFVTETEERLIERIADLIYYVRDIAFVWDDDNDQPKNLLNNAERMEIYNYVYNELRAIRATTDVLKRQLLAAKKRSAFENLCPRTYQVYRNCEATKNDILEHFQL